MKKRKLTPPWYTFVVDMKSVLLTADFDVQDFDPQIFC